jgi:3-oxoacyl-[acyl-carrier protein] reductase
VDLGIKGRRAVICASSAGLGKACALALAREGCEVVVNGRDQTRLLATAREIESVTGSVVHAVVADLNTEDGRAALLEAGGASDILVNNNAGPEPKSFLDIDRREWLAAFEANFFAAAFMIKGVVSGMRARKFGRIVNITSARVKSPTPAMGLSTSPRTALTALCKSLSLEVAVDNVTINNLLPERFETERQRFMAERLVQTEGIPLAEARRKIAESIAAKRMGDPVEFGDACAFLCSAQAGYISGQNLQLDGGTYRGLI